MSKKKGLSAEEKRTRMMEIFFETKDVFQLKDMEKIAPKEKGITSMSVKEVLQSLVDDGMVDCERIGTSNYYWAFPSKALHARKRKLEVLESQGLISFLKYGETTQIPAVTLHILGVLRQVLSMRSSFPFSPYSVYSSWTIASTPMASLLYAYVFITPYFLSPAYASGLNSIPMYSATYQILPPEWMTHSQYVHNSIIIQTLPSVSPRL
ncbi:meiotic nuclear division protein 1 homolog isoform X1 [Tamandua tetradactyla]|uniref:meiotic nuclear division protein 1 homolog isoform X1 n=1 Tax=Tamandua tetradactyla TaxID=48850 RepID=UPI004053BC25